jgi:hypothetical protein
MMMIRNLVLVIVLAGALGLGVGVMRHARRAGPAPIVTHEVAKPPVESGRSNAKVPDPARQEFMLLPADVTADRETPALAVDSEGRVLMAWASQTGELERTLYLARSSDGGAHFEPPVPWRKVPIYKYTSKGRAGGSGMTYSTHVLPRLASAGAEINLGWVEAIGGGPKVIYYVARSTDGGRSFSRPTPVHGAVAVRPGFTTLAADADGTLVAGWLDSRGKGQKPFVAVRPRGSDAFEPEQLVYEGSDEGDAGVCPCCDVGVLPAANGSPIVAFRNSDGGHRDIWLTCLRRDGKAGFQPAIPVTADAWTFDGCPHDGPALGRIGGTLHVLWMDAHTGKNRVYSASSPIDSWSFAPRPVNPQESGSQGHPKLAVSGRRLFAVWDEALHASEPEPAASSSTESKGHGRHHGPDLTGGGRAIMLAVSGENGAGYSPARAVAPRPGAFQLNPSLVVAADGTVLIAWNELDTQGKRIVFTRTRPFAGSDSLVARDNP